MLVATDVVANDLWLACDSKKIRRDRHSTMLGTVGFETVRRVGSCNSSRRSAKFGFPFVQLRICIAKLILHADDSAITA